MKIGEAHKLLSGGEEETTLTNSDWHCPPARIHSLALSLTRSEG